MAGKTLEQKIVTEFNKITGLLLRTGNTANTDKIAILMKQGQTVDNILNYAEDWYKMNRNNIDGDTAMNKFYSFAYSSFSTGKMPLSKAWRNGKKLVEPASKPVEVKESKPSAEVTVPTETKPVTSSVETQASGFLNQLGELLVNTVAKDKTDEIVAVVKEEAKAEVVKFVHDTWGELPKKIIIEDNGVTHEIKGIVHEKFEDVLKAVKKGKYPFLVGGAGTGKNVIAMQVAEALGLPFYFSNALHDTFDLTGWVRPDGTYNETPFYKAFKYGGLFMFDEIDGSDANVAIKFDEALSNGLMEFPAPIGNVKAHKDFHCIAAGNTYGLGADYEYVGRNVLDAATLNRFYPIEIDYSPAIEEALADGDKDLLKFVREFRKSARRNGIKALCTYRNLINLKDMKDEFSLKKVIEYGLTAMLKLDDLNIINNSMGYCGEWSDALNGIIDDRRARVA